MIAVIDYNAGNLTNGVKALRFPTGCSEAGAATAAIDFDIYFDIYPQEGDAMTRVAKLFMNGRSQAVRLPSEFRFDGDEVSIRKDPDTGDVILSRKANNWDEFFKLRDETPREELEAFVVPRDRTPPRLRKLF